MVKSKNLGLSLNGSSEQDVKMTFSSWRKSINGEGSDSNMNIIDRAIGAIQTAVEGFKNHKHSFSEITDKPDAYPPEAHGHPWSDITDKPTTFAPATHDHSYKDLKDKPSIPDVPAWAMQADKPSYSADEISYGDNSNVGEALGSLKDDLQTKIRINNYLIPTLQTTTLNGVTCTNNGDGTYTLNGTASNTFEVRLADNIYNLKEKYYACITKEIINGFYMALWYSSGVSDSVFDEKQITITNKTLMSPYLHFNSGTTFDNVVIKPMLTDDLSATYDDFVSYDDSLAKYHDVIDKASIGDAWTSGKTYAVGDYCIYGDQLYKCKTAHTAESAFNYNYWENAIVGNELSNLSDIFKIVSGGLLPNNDFNIPKEYRRNGEWVAYNFAQRSTNAPESAASGFVFLYYSLESILYGGQYAFVNGKIYGRTLFNDSYGNWKQIF